MTEVAWVHQAIASILKQEEQKVEAFAATTLPVTFCHLLKAKLVLLCRSTRFTVNNETTVSSKKKRDVQ